MSERVKVDIQINGDVFVAIKKLKTDFMSLTKTVQVLEQKTSHAFHDIKKNITLISFTALTDAVRNVSDAFHDMVQPGVAFQKTVHELSAITGITGKDLEYLADKAREVGKSSGLGASKAAEAFKLLASQISVDKIGIKGLELLQQETIKLAQASGLDMPAAANAMASAINQFGLKAEDASRVINVLAAGAKYGAAEVPELAQAFKMAGSAAASAGLDIEELTGGLEVLSKNAIKGSEAGTAMRNIILRMQTVLGIDFSKTSLSEALEALKPKLKDTQFLVQAFGVDSVNAAQFLIQNAEAVDEMTKKVTGTNVAYEQAAINTDTWAHKIEKFKAYINDFKISISNAVGPMIPFMEGLSGIAISISQMLPLFTLLRNVLTLTAIKTKLMTAYQWALNIAMNANPVGAIIMGITALIGVIALAIEYWDEITGALRRFGLWILHLIDKVFPGASVKIIGFFKGVWEWIDRNFVQPLVKVWNWLKDTFGFGKDKHTAELKITHKTEDTAQTKETGKPGQTPVLNFNNQGTKKLSRNTAGGSGGSGFAHAQKKEVNVHIDRLVDKIVVKVTHLQESTAKIRDAVNEALVSAVRDTEVALSS